MEYSSLGTTGPVIKVTDYGASATSLDNATAITAAVAAANAAAYQSLGTPTIRAVTKHANAGNATSFTVSATALAGDTVLVFVNGQSTAGDYVSSVVDPAGNVYNPLAPTNSDGVVTAMQIWATQPGAAHAFSGNITVTTNATQNIGGFAVVAYNVGSIGKMSAANNASSTAPSDGLTTEDVNNLVLTGVSFYNTSGTATITQNVGNLPVELFLRVWH